jgi:predicted GNAT family acetyltransferase
VDAAVGEGSVVLWVADGEPVSFACARRASPGCTRIGPVYTPPGLRGRGYAGAVVTATAARARGAGAEEVLLFSDVANHTAGELYARLGFEPVTDVVEADLA